MKRMLFNAAQPEESRVAIVDGQKLIHLDIETAGREQRKGNIYKGVITKIEPSLEACFVDYGTQKNGFLPSKEIHRSYFRGYTRGKVKLQEVLKEGDEVLVQVEKDERGNKGATLTTYVSLAGRYLVLMPNNPRGGGVSRRIEGDERAEIKNLINQLEIPKGMSVIVRTAGIGRSLEELKWDLDYQLKLWGGVVEASRQEGVQALILQESSLVIRAIRDYFQPDIGEILVDDPGVFEKIHQFISFILPHNLHKVKLYQDSIPLFNRFQIENQIDSVYARRVSLPSGGEIVIDHAEALVAIDVNSAKATRGADVEETALQTNLEAAEEIARQIRLRDIGGQIVIDFIDMEDQRNQKSIEDAMRVYLTEDRARVQTARLSRFGLMEISRQRLRVSLEESTHLVCPRCCGTGVIRGVGSSALHILRIIQERAMKENTGEVVAQVPVEVATFLLNEKREQLFCLEESLGVSIMIIPNKYLEVPHYRIERLRTDDVVEDAVSYQLVEGPPEESYQSTAQKNRAAVRLQAAVQGIRPNMPAPTPATQAKTWFSEVKTWFLNWFETQERKVKPVPSENFRQRNGSNSLSNSRSETRGSRTASRSVASSSVKVEEDKLEKATDKSKQLPQASTTDKGSIVRSQRKEITAPKRQSKSREDNISSSKVENQRVSAGEVKTTGMNQKPPKVLEKVEEKPKTQSKHSQVSNDKASGAEAGGGALNGTTTRPTNVTTQQSAKKHNRQRPPSASYLERRLHVDKIARYIHKTTIKVLESGGCVVPKAVVDAGLEEGHLRQEEIALRSVQTLNSEQVKQAREETQKDLKAMPQSDKLKSPTTISGGRLILVETKPELLRKATETG
ncbi:MAG: Rne/Rng family ribonuclease [Neisseriaceae bacterium]